MREQQVSKTVQSCKVDQSYGEDADKVCGVETSLEWQNLFLSFKPGIAKSDEDSVGDDAEGSDCAKEGSRVRNAGEDETICREQSGKQE